LLQRWTGQRTSPESLDSDLLVLQTKMRRVFESIFSH
jgi:hypothetical protein